MPEHSTNEDGSLTAEENCSDISVPQRRAYDLTSISTIPTEVCAGTDGYNINTDFDTESLRLRRKPEIILLTSGMKPGMWTMTDELLPV